MLDAGRSSLFAFDSNRIRPVSSDATLIPTIACANSGFCRISEIRACSSATVCVGVEILIVGEAWGVGTGLASGLAIGLRLGVELGVGLGVGLATAGTPTFRSRDGCCCALVTGLTDSVSEKSRRNISGVSGRLFLNIL